MTTRTMTMILGFAVVTAACGAAPPAHAPADDDPFARALTGVRDGHVSGAIGGRAVDDPAEPIALFEGPDQLLVVAVVQHADRALMLQLAVRNDIGLFVPGEHDHATRDDAARVRLLGCVGQSVGVYDEYEGLADEVTIVVDDMDDAPEAEGDVRVTVTGQWNAPAGVGATLPTLPTLAIARFVLER